MLWQGNRGSADTLRDHRHEQRSVIRDILKEITIIVPYGAVSFGVRGVSSSLDI